jgi:hypothetical protein
MDEYVLDKDENEVPVNSLIVVLFKDTGDYLLDNDKNIMKFFSKEDAVEFLKFLQYSNEYINNLIFSTYKEYRIKSK